MDESLTADTYCQWHGSFFCWYVLLYPEE